jgi:hypothetical protein
MNAQFLASLALAFHSGAAVQDHTACQRTYTEAMGVRAIEATFASGLPPTSSRRGRLSRYIRCQRNRSARPVLRRLLALKSTPAPMNSGIASWYYDNGNTGCGFHASFGVATLVAPCGSRFRICNGGSCIVATRDDSGPYVGGRTFDLDPASRAALACAGLCSVTWTRLT